MGRISKKRQEELDKIETEDTKLCSKCKKIKSLFEFNFSPVARKFARTICSKCEKENGILRKYGITLKDYDAMLEKQNGKCKICGTKKLAKDQGRFCVDHDHITSKIRGLLCYNCNHMLGNAKDDIKILASAIQYLTDSRK